MLEKEIEIVKETLENNTVYSLSKVTGVSITPLTRFKNGTSDIANMRLDTFKKILEYALDNQEEE